MLIYGDSITWESQRQLRAGGLEVMAYGGTAICDWFADMRRQAATKTVRTVYLEFVGNDFTPCVRNRAQLIAYRQDAITAVALWRAAGVRVVWVRPPEPRSDAVPTLPSPTPTPRPTVVPTSLPAPPPTPVLVPPAPTSTPTSTASSFLMPGTSPEATATSTPSEPPAPTPTGAPVLTPTGTLVPTSTPTETTPTPTGTPTPIPSGIPSAIALPTTEPSTGPLGALRAAAIQAAEVGVLPMFDQVQAVEQAAGPDAYVDTSALVAPGRVYVPYLPCRPHEPCGVLATSGFDAARAADGLHLCPTQATTVNGVVSADCSVYATSEQRFADAVSAGR